MLNLAVLVPPFCLYSPSVFLANKLPAGIFGQEGGKKKKTRQTVNFKWQKIWEESEFPILNCNSSPPRTSSLKIKPAQSGSQNPPCDRRSQLKRLSFLSLSIHKRAKTCKLFAEIIWRTIWDNEDDGGNGSHSEYLMQLPKIPNYL